MSTPTTTPNTLKTLTSTNLHDQLRQAMAQWQASAKTTHVSKALAAVMGSVRSHTVTRDGNWSTRDDVEDNYELSWRGYSMSPTIDNR